MSNSYIRNFAFTLNSHHMFHLPIDGELHQLAGRRHKLQPRDGIVQQHADVAQDHGQHAGADGPVGRTGRLEEEQTGRDAQRQVEVGVDAAGIFKRRVDGVAVLLRRLGRRQLLVEGMGEVCNESGVIEQSKSNRTLEISRSRTRIAVKQMLQNYFGCTEQSPLHLNRAISHIHVFESFA